MAKERKSEDPSYVHKNLARFIKMRGMKLSHLGKAVGCSGENIGQKLRGERKLHVDDVVKWCRVLNVTPAAALVEFEIFDDLSIFAKIYDGHFSVVIYSDVFV